MGIYGINLKHKELKYTMDFKVDKIFENIYTITNEGNIFTVILKPHPISTNENKLISEAFLLKGEEDELVCYISVPFMSLISYF